MQEIFEDKLKSKRTIFIGDVHGCYDELMILLEKIKFQQKDNCNDELIFLGDLINKGPYSLKVIDFVKNSAHQCVMGNHELAFIKALRGERDLIKGLKSLYDEMGEDVGEYRKWIEKLPYYIEGENFIAVHAGLAPNIELSEQEPHVLTHIRTWDGHGRDLNNENDPAWFDLYQGKKKVVFGHWAQRGIISNVNVLGLDSGCCWGGELSLYILEEDRIVSTKALKQYKDPGLYIKS